MTRTRVTLYGGVNEIGGNKFLLEEGDDRVLLDFGTSIGARGEFLEAPFLGPRNHSVLRDLYRLGLLPDIDGVYREDYLTVAKSETDRDLPESAAEWRRRSGGRAGVDAVLLTHAHIDHFQDLTFLDPEIPVHCTRTTLTMLQAMEEMRSADSESEIVTVRERRVESTTARSALGAGRPTVKMHDRARAFVAMPELVEERVGNFRVTAIPVDHSVPGGCAFHIRTPRGKTVLYTGDVRFHGNLADRTSHLRKAFEGREPDILLTEGTRIDSESADSEADVERGLGELVREADGLVVAEFAWKDTTRLDTVQKVAANAGRTLLVDARAAYLLKRLDGDPGVPTRDVRAYPHVGVYVRRRKSMLDQVDDYPPHEAGYRTDWGAKDLAQAQNDSNDAFLAEALAHYKGGVRAKDVAANPSKYIVHLSFWSSFELLDLAPPAGSRWIRCQTEPYSDEMALTLDRQRRWLDTLGMAHNLPETEKGDPGVLRTPGRVTHVSGHGAGPDLLKLVKSAKARTIVPVHTDAKNVHKFAGVGADVRTFGGATYRSAGRGKCVVEI